MAKKRRSKIALLREQFKNEYDKITQEIKKLEGQRDGLVQAIALIDDSTGKGNASEADSRIRSAAK